MRKGILFFILIIAATRLRAQVDTMFVIPLPDTLAMKEVVIQAYEQDNNIVNAPAAVAIVADSDMNRYSNSSILPAINNTPGVRMEERSPGSYRLGIRGSAANTPFGVRNVKVYYNGIPYTDAGGNTYLNQLGFYNFQHLEIVREPGASLYGAGTGGVVLVNSLPQDWQRSVQLHYTVGSYGLHNIVAEVHAGDTHFKNTIRYQRQQYDGYRKHTELQKDVFSWDARIHAGERGSLNTHFLYGKLHYETPGGLTAAQYEANPEQARPTEGMTAGAEQNKAAVNQEMMLAGITYEYYFNRHWQNSTTLFARFTSLDNPTIRNYSKVSQPGFGGRRAK